MKNKNQTTNFIHETAKKSFVIGLAVAIKSIFSIAKLIFLQNPHYKYILSYKFSQDHIEILFARFRQKFGANNNPNVLQFKVAPKQILLKNAIKCKTNGNCNSFDDDVFGALLDFKWNKKKDNTIELHFDKINEIDQETMNRSILLNFTNSSMRNSKLNILYYITGYVVRQISKHINCDSCIQSLILSQNCIEHNYSVPKFYTKLTSSKNLGGLILSSDSSFKVI